VYKRQSLHNPDDQVSSTTSVAVEASFICAVHWGSFNELCAASPGIAAEFIRLVVKAGAQARELLTLIRDKEALERIAGFLLNLSDRLQLRGVQGRELSLIHICQRDHGLKFQRLQRVGIVDRQLVFPCRARQEPEQRVQ